MGATAFRGCQKGVWRGKSTKEYCLVLYPAKEGLEERRGKKERVKKMLKDESFK